jgi:arsenate reductase
LKKSLKAVSVGIKLSFEVRPLAVKAMAEVGIDTSNYKPKPLDEFRKKKVDLVVSVCNNADEECPV